MIPTGRTQSISNIPRGAQAGTPRWAPGGQQIAFHSTEHGQSAIYVIGAEGGRATRLTRGPAGDINPTWSRDGQWVYFSSLRSGQHQIWKVAAAGGDAVQVTRFGGYTAFESSDGQFIYYTKDSGWQAPLWKVPVDGGEEGEVLPSVWLHNFFVVDEGIYFIPFARQGRFSIQFYDFNSARVRRVAELPRNPAQGISVSPDGASMLYTLIDAAGGDLMLVENFW